MAPVLDRCGDEETVGDAEEVGEGDGEVDLNVVARSRWTSG